MCNYDVVTDVFRMYRVVSIFSTTLYGILIIRGTLCIYIDKNYLGCSSALDTRGVGAPD